jgi:4-amino-4-deoxy-L-arabinose transferase-like glycosyltransferase
LNPYIQKLKNMPLRKLMADKVFLIIWITGLLIRIAWSFFPTYPETDFMWYHVKAMEISEGKGFLNGVYPFYEGVEGRPTAFRPIGYPATLSLVYYFTGARFFAGKMLNVFLSAVSMLLLFAITRKFFSRRFSIVVVFLLSFSPLAILYTGILGSEILFMTLLLLSAYFTLVQRKPLWLGLTVGYMALVRPIGIYFLGCIVLFILLEKQLDRSRKIKQLFAVIGFSMLIILSWVGRNAMVLGTPVFSTNGGYVAYVNNNPYATGSWSDPFSYPDSPFLKYRHDTWFDELSMHQEGKALALSFIKENPSAFLKLGIKRMQNSYWSKLDDSMWAFTVGVDRWHPFSSLATRLQALLYRPFYVLVWLAIGLLIAKAILRKLTAWEGFVLLIFGYYNGMMFLLEGNSRYLFPLFPFYAVLVVWLLSKVPTKAFWIACMEDA